MMDVITKAQRSRNMSAIRSKNTKPELYLRKLLFSKGYRYRINAKYIIGHPDMFLRKYNTAIFVNGCFWHRHVNCKFAYVPKSRIEFWERKFEQNKTRDILVLNELRKQGIKTVVVWECTIKSMKKDPELCKKILDQIEIFVRSEILKLEL